jgi:hypothetical protein
MSKYNLVHRAAVLNCRSDAVVALRGIGYSVKTVAYTLGIKPDSVRCIAARRLRRTISPNITSKHTA